MGCSDLAHNTHHTDISKIIRLRGGVWNGRNKRLTALSDPTTPWDAMTLNHATISYLNKLMGESMGSNKYGQSSIVWIDTYDFQ